MANVIRQFPKPKVLLMDVSGTLTQGTFIPGMLVPYFQKNHKAYLEENIDHPNVRDVIGKLRTAASMDRDAPKILQPVTGTETGRAGESGEKVALIEAVTAYVDYCLRENKENKPLILYRFLVWFDGYDRGLIATPVYADVAIQIKKWRHTQGIKLYVISNGWSVATKKFLEKTNQGDVGTLIEDYFDTAIGSLYSGDTYRAVLERLHAAPQDAIFLTKSADEARAAISVGIFAVLVLTHRKDVEAIQEEVKEDVPHVRTFNEIEFI